MSGEDPFVDIESRNGLRTSWNVWPTSRVDAGRMIIPFGSLYTPLKKIKDMPVLDSQPILCKKCRHILNPHCRCDYNTGQWICPICLQANEFPAHFKDVNEQNLPCEIHPYCTTIEYILPQNTRTPPAFVFVVDTCLGTEELQGVKDALICSLMILPPEALVGLITFGTTAQIYDLSSTEIIKSHVFVGNRDVPTQQLAEYLSINPTASMVSGNKFLRQLSECEMPLTQIIEEMQPDPWPQQPGQRPIRCTGVALSLSLSLLEITCPNGGGRSMLFVHGPCTQGPGLIVGRDLKETIRAHHNIQTDSGVSHVRRAQTFYNNLAARATTKGFCVDILMGAKDQIGLYEMSECISTTGGLTLLTDNFANEIFKENFMKIFEDLDMAFNATLSIQTTQEVKVAGALGHCHSLKRKAPNVADLEIGQAGTFAWKICAMNSNSTLAFFFEIAQQHNVPIAQGNRPIVQYLTEYLHPSGRRVLRVTTMAYTWADATQNLNEIALGFDQEAAAVLIGRLAVWKTHNEQLIDILRWIDRSLIRLCQKFATYTKGDVGTFRLSAAFSLFPQFLFYLRRSRFLRLFNYSPDETAYYRCLLFREDSANSIMMIQPTLFAYTFGQPPRPVLLDVQSIDGETIFLLDTFFRIIIFHGENIVYWRTQGLHLQPEHQNLKELLGTPLTDAETVRKDRFPMPLVMQCDQNSSQARFFISQLNPSIAQASQNDQGAQNYFSDDVSLKTFMDHLKKLAVQP
eukprot:gnl/Trimastix_PCT/1282.p1 GENE.gnl/Trimastix_PCT/1282~~gnl/Trimastix_PCT/1282.p1  ORF type:complete len:761 (+),score=284.41 gnl/Trimastix_PCT/1282:56-2284(+)